MNPHARHPATLFEMFRSFWRNRGLIWQMSRRDVIEIYRGSVLGLVWAFFLPLIMLAVYTFIFGVVFKARWGIDADIGKTNFAVILFCGLIVHGLFAECVNRAPGLILANVNYVKRVVFPLEILPMVAMGTSLFKTMTSLIVLIGAMLALQIDLHASALYTPIILMPLTLITMGVAWLIAATGVYVRDMGQTVGILTTVMLFVSPVFFPVSSVPAAFQKFLFMNPLTFIIEQLRDVLIWGHAPNWMGLLVYCLLGLMFSWFGFWWFQRTRKGFSDVL